MPEDRNKLEELKFTDAPGTDKAILGTLEGPCADFMDSTRNNRQYDESLWDKVFTKDSIVSEMIENGGIPGELDHPIDREETDSSRVAILMREKPVKKNGGLWAKFDILNTPLGKIAYTLAKAGFKFGISSRGSGDLYTGSDGKEHVDEDTYEFRAFDLVLLPAVKSARLNLVTEGLQKSFDYKRALRESIESEVSDEDKKLMRDTLKSLNIDADLPSSERIYPVEFLISEATFDTSDSMYYRVNVKAANEEEAMKKAEKFVKTDKWKKAHSELKNLGDPQIGDRTYSDSDLVESVNQDAESKEDTITKSPPVPGVDIDAAEDDFAADSNGAKIIEQLQIVLARNHKLEDQIATLNEKLSVCYAKESAQEDKINSYKSQIMKLTESAKKTVAQAKDASILTEQLNSVSKKADMFREKYESIQKSLSASTDKVNKLYSTVNEKEQKIQSLTESMKELKKSHEQDLMKIDSKKDELNEQLEGIKKDSAIKHKEYVEKLAKANQLVEKYKRIAKNATDKYVESRAHMIGVSPNEVKSKLGESFTLSDVDKVIDDMAQYRLNMNNLPFEVSRTTPRVKLTESKKDPLVPENDWDTLDPQLLMLSGLK